MEKKEKLLVLLKELNDVAQENNIPYYLVYGSLLGAVRHKGFIPWDNDIDIAVPIDKYQDFCFILNERSGQKYKVYTYEDNKYTALFSRFGMVDEPHHKIHIDIFPLVGAPNTKIKKYIFSKIAYYNFMLFYMKRVDIKERFAGNRRKTLITKVAKVLLYLLPEKIFISIKNALINLYPIERSTYLYNLCGTYGMKEYVLKSWFDNVSYLPFEHLLVPCPEQWDKYLTQTYGDYMVPKKY